MDDFILEDSGDLLIRNGDFVIGNADGQHENDILQTVPGEYKINPQVGCDLGRFLKSNTSESEIKNVVKRQLELDRFQVDSIEIQYTEGGFLVIPSCERI